MSPTPRLSRTQLLSYSLPAISMSTVQIPLQYFLPAFYATQMGVSLGVIGTIFLVTRLWDVITDLVMGTVCDRFPSRFGRRRHWIAISVPILVVSGYMIFMPPQGVGAAYLFGWLIVLYIGWTLLMISHFAWGAELASDYDERTRINGARDAMGLLGVVVLMFLPAIVEQFTGPDDAQRVTLMGWLMIALIPLTTGIALANVPEYQTSANTTVSRFSTADFLRGVKIILRNAALGRLLIADLLTGYGITTTAVLFVFMTNYVYESAAYLTTALGVYYIGGTIGIRLWVRVSHHMGKHRTMSIAKIIMVLSLPIFFLIPKGSGLALISFMGYYGMIVSSGTFLLRAITADVVDLDQARSNDEGKTGLFYGLLLMTSKLGMALAIGSTYLLLDFIGFTPTADNDQSALSGLTYLFIGLPMLVYIVVAAVMWNFPVDRKRQRALRAEIDRRQVSRYASAEDGQPSRAQRDWSDGSQPLARIRKREA